MVLIGLVFARELGRPAAGKTGTSTNYRDAWFYEPPAGGHGYGKDNRERAHFIALGYAFLRRAIGWE